MADFSVVMDKLNGFETAEGLAEFFRGYGIKAQPGRSRLCAVSKFVMEETGSFTVNTNKSLVVMYEETENDSYNVMRASSKCSDVLSEFISKFDRGYYLDLVQDGIEVDYIPFSVD